MDQRTTTLVRDVNFEIYDARLMFPRQFWLFLL
jgi:hypothetical protein